MDEFEEMMMKAKIIRQVNKYGIEVNENFVDDFVDDLCHPEKTLERIAKSIARIEELERMNRMMKKDEKRVKYLNRQLEEIMYGRESYFSRCYNSIARLFRG